MSEANKPAGAGAPPEAHSPEISRRELMRKAMFGTIGLFAAQAAVGSGVFMWPTKVTGFGGKVKVPKKVSEISPSDEPLRVNDGKFYLSRVPEGVIALYWRCVHLGCTVPWNKAEDAFHCPCHGSVYTRTGQNIAGPAPRPLDYMEVEITSDGEIIVDTGKIIQRDHHDPSHITKV
jgi:cytochrome b6-f complex iron-sulfur subunit